MTEAPLHLDDPQKAALDVGASVWVAASAGTGKTKVLTDRVLALLLAGTAPQRILCLTFTKAAAAEMAIRINDRLSQWTTVGDGALAEDLVGLTQAMPDRGDLDHARRLFARVLDVPGGMRIETIHAFCQSLLRRFPLEAGVAPHFELIEEFDAAELLETAREEVLDLARRGQDPALAAALAEVTRHVSEQAFGELIGACALERTKLARAMRGGPAAHGAAQARLLGLEAGESEETIVAAACRREACDGDLLARAADTLLLSHAKGDRERGQAIKGWLVEPIVRFDDYCAVFFTKERELRKTLASAAFARNHPTLAAALEAEAVRLDAVIERLGAAALMQASGALAMLAHALLVAYERHKAAHALLDFDDLVLKAKALLRRRGVAPWVLYKLDGGLDHILIDEAQDTNPDQWDVVAALAEEFFAGDGARSVARTVFAVGDAKQSIYSFQRADPAKFFAMRNHFSRSARSAEARWKPVDLDVSFRSTAPVLAAVDAVFARAEARDGVALDGAAIRHRASRAGAAGLVELWPPVEPVDIPAPRPWEAPVDQQTAREPRARLALAIAATIRTWLEQGERLPSRDRAVRPGDVMVLVRRRGPFVAELVRALKQAAVAVAGVDRMLLTDQLAVADLMALLQFLVLPEDDLTLATVLKGPLFGLDEDRLFDLAHPRGDGTRLWTELRRRAEDHPVFGHAAQVLSDLLARADFMPPYELLASVLSAEGGRERILGRLGPEAEDPLDELLAAAIAYERTHAPSLQGFLHWLAVGETEVKRDLDQHGRDEVRVITVHGAKGLQAPIVFLPDTLAAPLQKPPLLWSPEGLPLWRAERRMEVGAAATALGMALRRRDEEYRRLLYVAMTRAEDRLYVCGWRGKRNPPAGSWYELVAAGMAALPGVREIEVDTTQLIGPDGWRGRGLCLAARQETPARSRERVLARDEPTAGLPDWTQRPPPAEPTPPRPLAPSRPEMPEPATRSPLGEDQGARFKRGRLVHRLLQSLPELPPAARPEAARRFLALPVHGLLALEQAELARETLTVLSEPAFAPLFGPGSRAEVPVVGLIGGRAVAGQIDRLVVSANEVLIVDYKTLRPPPKRAEEVPRIYLGQLAAYRAAVADLYKDRIVRCALLWTDGPRLMAVDGALLATSKITQAADL